MLDLPYPDFLCGLQLPEHLRYVCATSGFPEPDLGGEFTYCDLGCGQGRTASAVAALHPQAKVWGLDLSTDHISAAKAFADQAGLKNVTFLEADLAAFDAETLPPLDFITMHGVWAWIPDQVRAGILKLIMQRLKPGGLCYVSYNAMPGAVALGAIRRMCLDLLQGQPQGNITESLPRAFRQLKRLAQGEGLFFQKHPVATKVIATSDDVDVRYMAHEYLADQWAPMSIKEVADTMQGAGLTWVNSCILAHRLHAAGLPPALRQEIEAEDDRLLREVLSDIALNRQFRADVFVKAENYRPQDGWLDGFSFALTTSRETVPPRAVAEGIEIDTSLQPIPFILDALAHGPLVFEGLAEMLTGRLSTDDLTEVLMALIVVDVIRPLPKGGITSAANEKTSGLRVLDGFNRAALAKRQPSAPVTMITSALGGIVSIPPLDAALIQTFCEHEGHVDAASLLVTLKQSNIAFEGTPEEINKKAEAAVARFTTETLPKLQRLGMLH